MLGKSHLEAGTEQADTASAGIAGQFLQGGGTDFTARGIDYPQEGVVIIRVYQQTQVGHDVFHFAVGEEGGAATEMIGNALFAQRLLEGTRLVVAAVENGVVAIITAVLEAVMHDLGDHLDCLVLIIGSTHNTDWISVTQLTPERLIKDVGIIFNKLIGGLEDTSHGAVVLLQFDHLQVGKVLIESCQVFRTGTAPGID